LPPVCHRTLFELLVRGSDPPQLREDGAEGRKPAISTMLERDLIAEAFRSTIDELVREHFPAKFKSTN
jgi:hypothetical protein